MGLRGRIKRALDEASGDGIVIRLRDGRVKVFDNMTIRKQMYLTKVDLACGRPLKRSEVLEAVRAATPESRAAFEAEYGPITPEARIIASEEQGGWAEAYKLEEDGSVTKVRHEGGTEAAKRLREEAQASASREPGAF